MSRLVSRDPFARTALYKESVGHQHGRKCDWCGRETMRLYRFRTESDGGRKNTHKGLFCSKSCHDDYHS